MSCVLRRRHRLVRVGPGRLWALRCSCSVGVAKATRAAIEKAFAEASSSRERIRGGDFALNLVQSARPELGPKESRRIDRSGQREATGRNNGKSERREERRGANRKHAVSSGGPASRHGFPRQRQAKAVRSRRWMYRKRSKKEYRRAGIRKPYPADPDDFSRLIERNPRQRRLRNRAAFSHALAGLGQTAGAKRGVEHANDCVAVLRFLGN